MRVVRKTQSLCPQCLRVLDAHYATVHIEGQAWFFLQKCCPEHGEFSAPVWVDLPNTPSFTDWYIQSPPHHVQYPITALKDGCPFDCGLCPEHSQHTCCCLLEVTQRCNLRCPVCYASAASGTTANRAGHNTEFDQNDPSLEHLEKSLERLWQHAGAVNVQLSGGEPTMRHDLAQIIGMAKGMGFPFVQLNTNGIRLGNEADYAHKLAQTGLNLVYLQWDDVCNFGYETLRGTACLEVKEKALEHCIKAGLAVVLVATVVKGVNDTALGAIVQKALASGSLVRGVHIQPVSFFGRYPWTEDQAPRITIPEILYNLEAQTQGLIKASHFKGPQSEHALCSFNAVYERKPHGSIVPSQGLQSCCAPTQAAKRAQEFVATHWNTPACSDTCLQGFDTALHTLQHRFTISGMAFQDSYTLDLERLRRCHVHILSDTHTIIPFCAYNLTSQEGVSLYRNKKRVRA